MDRQSYFDTAFEKAKERGYEAKKALEIAKRSLNNFVPPVEEVSGVRSLAFDPSFKPISDNMFDILVGYPDSMLEEGLSDSLDSSGWESFDRLETKSDIGHYSHRSARGENPQIDEKWENFLVDSELYKNGNEIRAKVKVPEDEKGQEFLEKVKSGEFGASIEYRGEKKDDKITNWEITGFSFVEDPHYDRTKQR